MFSSCEVGGVEMFRKRRERLIWAKAFRIKQACKHFDRLTDVQGLLEASHRINPLDSDHCRQFVQLLQREVTRDHINIVQF